MTTFLSFDILEGNREEEFGCEIPLCVGEGMKAEMPSII